MSYARKFGMLRSRTVLLFVLLSLVGAPRLIAQDAAPEASAPEAYVDIPGTRVSIRIPPGFSLAQGFPGIVRDEYRAALATTEIPSPIQEVLGDMTEQNLAAEGMTLLRSERFTVSGIEATLFHARQEDPDGAVRKWLVLFGDEKLTVMLAASVPEFLEPEVGKSLEECLLTAHWDASKTVDPYAGMGFSLRESAIFEIRGRRPGGVLLTRKEAAAELTPSEPIIVVYPSASPEIAPLPLAAMKTLTEGDQFVEFENFVERPLSVNGLNGYEIIADAKEASMSIPVRILLMVVRASDRDMIIEAIVESAGWDQYVPEFHAIAESLQITSAGPAH